jgi:cytochrome oxidase assembly protein ShyY1
MSIAIRRLKGNSKKLFCEGSLYLGLTAGFVGYWNYRIAIKKEFLLSHAHYRLSSPVRNMTPFEPIWMHWFRMPEKEYTIYHKFMPYYIIGQLDYSKEILIPKDRVVDGKKQKGFDVINPLYCYDGGKFNVEFMHEKNMIRQERAAMIIHRGWIPYEMKNKKTRPWETNSNQLVKVKGIFRQAEDHHYYKHPNNPTNNEWNNLALHDIAIFWELPNANELKQFYFQAVDIGDQGGSTVNNSTTVYKWPHVLTKDELVRDYYSWWTKEGVNRGLYYSLGSVSLASWLFFFMTI